MWRLLGRAGPDAIVICSPELIRYLTGFTGSESILLICKKEKCLFVDSRYTDQASYECRDVKIIECAKKTDGVVQYIAKSGLKRIAFDPKQLTVWDKNVFDANGAFTMVAVPEMDGVRATKDATELKLMRKAAKTASRAFMEVVDDIQAADMEEKELASRLELAIRRKGADALPFPIIVASGVRGSLPHGLASDKKIRKGDFVTIDFGSVYQGYCSDETCTVVIGQPKSKQKRVYQVVKDAHDRAMSAVKPGVTAERVDAVARETVQKAGLGRYFRHGTGHGVGLAVHEEPRIAPGQKTVIERNMVFTIEPGVYIPGWGGVRIEDMVRVTDDGCEILSSVSKELFSL